MSGVGGMMSSMLSNQYSNMSDQDLRRQYDAYSRLNTGIMGGAGSFLEVNNKLCKLKYKDVNH